MTHPWTALAAGPRRRGVAARWAPQGALIVLVAGLLTLLAGLGLRATQAADAPDPAVTIAAEPLLGGLVRPAEWTAIRVRIENAGPAVDGELRLSTLEQGSTTFGMTVQLATGARQEHTLFGRSGFFSGRFAVSLVSDGATIAKHDVAMRSLAAQELGVGLVAERPERILDEVRGSLAARGGRQARVAAFGPDELPLRVESWAALDRLVWQDVPFGVLTPEQLDALQTWVALGGDLVIVAGSMGVAGLDGIPDELLPYRPERIVDLPAADLVPLLGEPPAGVSTLPVLAGPLERGTALAETSAGAIAARLAHGQGSVVLVGIDPAAPGLVGTAAAGAVWARVLSTDAAPVEAPEERDDSVLVDALNLLPSVEMPRMDHLFLLFVAYVALLGPLNYLVLRRLDRREWAWITMPVLIAVFAVAAYVFGTVLKGSTVVVKELGVVRGAAGTDRGVADIYVGIFAPSRTTFDVRMPGGALLSRPLTESDEGRIELPFDVLLGDPARLRGFEVGFGSLRPFRAESAVVAPRIEADLQLVGDHLEGSVSNASDLALEQVSLVYGGAHQALADMPPGAARTIDLTAGAGAGGSLARRLFQDWRADDVEPLVLASRLAIINHVSGARRWDGDRAPDPFAGDGPVVLAWRSGGILGTQLGTDVDRVGDTLYVLPVRVVAVGPVTFQGSAIAHSMVEADSAEIVERRGAFSMDHGTMTVDYRPAGFEGTLDVAALSLRLTNTEQRPGDELRDLVPLPEAEQPDQADPIRTGPQPPAPGIDGTLLPQLQLFDRVAGRWVEFVTTSPQQSYRVTDATRYVDATGGFQARFVNRSRQWIDEFGLGVRIEGTAR